MRGPSVQGARRSVRGGVLEQYVEHGEQAQRSNGGPIACLRPSGGEKCGLARVAPFVMYGRDMSRPEDRLLPPSTSLQTFAASSESQRAIRAAMAAK